MMARLVLVHSQRDADIVVWARADAGMWHRAEITYPRSALTTCGITIEARVFEAGPGDEAWLPGRYEARPAVCGECRAVTRGPNESLP